ncbi:MAG: flavin reductase family protein [Desulfitobacteriaceae bacterium]
MGEKRWRCSVCGYIHVGEAPPEVCPVCGVDSTFFELLVEEPAHPTQSAQLKEKSISGLDIPRGIKPALYKISYGLYIITSRDGDKINGQCANTAFQVTSEPATVAVGINKQNYTHQFIEASGLVGISILGQQEHDLVRKFGYQSGRNVDKFIDVSYKIGPSGVPILDEAIAFLEGRVTRKMDCGTHTLFLLEITSGEIRLDAEPMTYAYFRATK